MDASLRLRCVQHDNSGVIPSALFVIPSQSEESSAWMLRSAQHDKSENVIASAVGNPVCGGLLFLSFCKERNVSATPKQSEANPVCRFCFVQHKPV